MKEKTLLAFELPGRGIIAIITTWVTFNMISWLTLPVTIIMVLWILNPLFEYKTYGGN